MTHQALLCRCNRGQRPGPAAGLASHAAGLVWVPKIYATWADALGIAVGSVKRLGVGGPVLARPEVG